MKITTDRTILGLVLFSLVTGTTFALNSNNSSNEVCFPGNINNNNLRLNGSRGTFESPKGYPLNSSCDWLLTVPEGNIVKLVFDSFHLESDRYSRVCLRDYVEVLDGNSSSSASKGRFCGNRSPEKIRSSGRYMWVRFRSDNVWSWHTGFMATFTAEDNSACPYYGRVLHASASYIKTLTSPNFPSNYDKNEQCKWILEALGGFIVKVTFNDFRLDGAIYGDCNDKLTFYDGNSTASKLLGKAYCGSTRPDVIYSTGRYLFVEFKTDDHDFFNYKGFKLAFSAANKEEASGICRTSSYNVHQLSGSTGTFFTPYYPVPYPEHWTCIWQISVPSGKRVKLIFEGFDIGPYDSLQIRDGKLSQSAELHHYRGEDVYSSGSYMRVEFNSKSRSWSIGRKGFKARFEAIGPPGNPKEFCFLGNIYNNNLKLTGSSGTLQSPEERYPSHLSCTWLITVPDGKIVRLSFQKFSLPGSTSSKCTPDYVEILDGNFSYSESRGRLCGNKKPEDILSSGRYMTVRFRSGDIKSFHDGFEAKFAAENAPVEPVAATTSRELCWPGNVNNENLKLTGTDGTLQTPLKFYPPNLVCIWLITVPEEKMVQLSFERFDLDPNGCFDYVEIRDGKDNEGSSLGTYCGTDSIPAEIQSSDRYMWIRFHSDYEAGVSRTGFKATFKAISKPKTLVIAVAVVASLVGLIALICCVMCVRKRRNKRGEAGGERIPMAPATTSASRPTQSEAIDTTPPPVGYAPVPTNSEATTHLLSNQVELPPPYPGTG